MLRLPRWFDSLPAKAFSIAFVSFAWTEPPVNKACPAAAGDRWRQRGTRSTLEFRARSRQEVRAAYGVEYNKPPILYPNLQHSLQKLKTSQERPAAYILPWPRAAYLHVSAMNPHDHSLSQDNRRRRRQHDQWTRHLWHQPQDHRRASHPPFPLVNCWPTLLQHRRPHIWEGERRGNTGRLASKALRSLRHGLVAQPAKYRARRTG